jgi:hypothetical protein
MDFRNPNTVIEFITGCCEKLPNGNLRFTSAGKIRMKEVFAEHGITVVMDEGDEIHEFQVRVNDTTPPGLSS